MFTRLGGVLSGLFSEKSTGGDRRRADPFCEIAAVATVALISENPRATHAVRRYDVPNQIIFSRFVGRKTFGKTR